MGEDIRVAVGWMYLCDRCSPVDWNICVAVLAEVGEHIWVAVFDGTGYIGYLGGMF